MGEIADMMLGGEMCEMCGVPLDGEGYGAPRYCSKSCARDRGASMEQVEGWSKKPTQDAFLLSLAARLTKYGYTVEIKTPYHFRVNNCLDVYPQNRKWHDIKQNKRGEYEDIFRFAKQFFTAK